MASGAPANSTWPARAGRNVPETSRLSPPGWRTRPISASVTGGASLRPGIVSHNSSGGWAPSRPCDWSTMSPCCSVTCASARTARPRSCAPSCPCLFGSAPTLGHCDGLTLIEIEKGHFGDVGLDGVKVLAVYRGGTWMKFYVDKADEAQTEAAVKLLPTFEKFFAIENVLEVKNVPISVERTAETMKITVPNTTAEIEIMKGKNGKPIKIENLPSPAFPAPPFLDHTQYRSVVLKHEAEDKRFEYSGTNGFTARIEAVAPAGG